MSQNQPQASTLPHAGAEVPYVAPPPAGYPMTYEGQPQNPPPAETQYRGDGFWKGCCAALCCCCVLDACF